MAGSFANWLLNNIGKARRWRCNTGPGAGDPLGHDWEGGVDIPLPAGTPIYALATGPLMGAGTFTMGAGGFGHGVVTQNVNGVGQVYYQHIDLAPGIPHCKSGSCGGYVVQEGQLLGHSTSAIGEVEIGINATWGGIWGTNKNNALWVCDPRAALKALANGTSGGTTGGSNLLITTLSNAGSTPNVTCQGAKAGSCKPCSGLPNSCPSGETCVHFNSDGSTILAPPSTSVPTGVCVSNSYVSGHTPPGVLNPTNPLGLPDWIIHPDWMRVLKFIGGFLCLSIGLAVVFWPQAEKIVGDAAKVAAV